MPHQSLSAKDSQSIATVAADHEPTDTNPYRGEVRHGAETVLKTFRRNNAGARRA